MPNIQIHQGDITRLVVDGVVNAANEGMLGGGGVDGAIHRAAGPQLLRACRDVSEIRPGVRCPTGDCRITDGFDLPAKYVIHTAGPVWDGGGYGEREQLASCYRSCLKLASERQLQSIAFPAISCGIYGFPIDEAAKISIQTIRDFFQNQPSSITTVTLVAFDKDVYESWATEVES